MQFNWTELTNNTTACYIAIAVVVLTTIYYYLKNKDIPPGPKGLPYIGYWPFLKTNTCHLQLQELGKKYGDIFSFSVTGRLYINLGSFKANREAFISKSEYFSLKPSSYTVAGRLFRGSVIVLNGEEWKTNRKFFVQQFRERGVSNIKGEMCGPIYDAIKGTIEDLQKTNGTPTDIVEILTNKCTSVLFRTCFGESGITEKEIRGLNETYAMLVESITGPNLLLCGTFAKYFIFPFLPTYRNIVRNVTIMEIMLQKIINRHKATMDEGNIRNIIDAYYKEKKERQSKNDPTAQYFTDYILVGTLVQFIGDGVLAVAAFISSFFYTLIQHPEEQEKIYKELMEVVGSSREPTMDDKNKLPYTNAFIAEMIRTSNSFPFFPKLECSREVNLGGYRIPKGAVAVMNIWSSHNDPEVYENPQEFNPSRFLAVEGKKKPEQPMLFGMGKHSCIGESFTMAQVFLFLTTIVKHFHLSAAESGKHDIMLFFSGRLKICAHPRKE